jgi:hypothetical protein
LRKEFLMVLFEPVVLRLKEQLGVSTDKQVAALLGLSPTAFNDRKRRDAFPEDKLLALVATRPDLKLDVAYILTGDRAVVHAMMGAVRAAAEVVERLGGTKAQREARSDVLLNSVTQALRQNLTPEEQLLVGRYRASSQEARDSAMRTLLGEVLDDPDSNGHLVKAEAGPPSSIKAKALGRGQVQQINAPLSNAGKYAGAQIGSVVQGDLKGSPKIQVGPKKPK